MIETIRTYPQQFQYQPQTENAHQISKGYKQVVLCGMGGSHLPAGILKTIKPGINIFVHRDYGLPPFDKNFLESSLLIASSFSGNTEEVLSFYDKAKQFDLSVAVISTGGALLKRAIEDNNPYIQLPQTDFTPRTALGISTLGLAHILQENEIVADMRALSFDMKDLEARAQDIATQIGNKIPLIYASNQNLHIAYNWKIKCNETAKIPAFYNVFPEMNHNEMESFDFADMSKFVPIFLEDSSDLSSIQKRFKVFQDILDTKGIAYVKIDISHASPGHKVFSSLILGDFATALVASTHNVPSTEVPLIEEFKKRLI